MYKSEAIKHYTSRYKIAQALGIGRSAVTKWGKLVPELQARRLEELSGGALKFRAELYRRGQVRA